MAFAIQITTVQFTDGKEEILLDLRLPLTPTERTSYGSSHPLGECGLWGQSP